MTKPARMADLPPVDDDVDPQELDRRVRRDLRSLPKELADRVGRRLAMAQRLLDEDPAAALMHAREARRLASRLAVAREALGVVAYYAQEWSTALTELRAARRIAGTDDYLPMMMDAERASGRREKAREIYDSAATLTLSVEVRAELDLVASGMEIEDDNTDAARALLSRWLDSAQLSGGARARVRYAYAELLSTEGKTEEAQSWFQRAAQDDKRSETLAASRILEMDGFVLGDIETYEEAEEDAA